MLQFIMMYIVSVDTSDSVMDYLVDSSSKYIEKNKKNMYQRRVDKIYLIYNI